jgi:aerobic C4-dicarboxylate transport protein
MALLRPLRHLYVQVLIGVALGVLVGALWPDVGEALKPLGDGFIRLIKMIIAPVIFCTVAAGIAHMTDFKSFGRLGAKTLIYFEVVSTLALIVGLAVGATLRPGVGFGMQVSAKDAAAAAEYAKISASSTSF